MFEVKIENEFQESKKHLKRFKKFRIILKQSLVSHIPEFDQNFFVVNCIHFLIYHRYS